MADDPIAFDLLATVETPVRSFRAGDVIFNEGDRAEESYVIQRGQVEIRRNGRLLDTLTEKSIFGEMALIDRAPRAATAVAATDVVDVGAEVALRTLDHVGLRIDQPQHLATLKQAEAALVYALMIWPTWMARGVVGGRQGNAVFVAVLAAAVVAVTLRLHL